MEMFESKNTLVVCESDTDTPCVYILQVVQPIATPSIVDKK